MKTVNRIRIFCIFTVLLGIIGYQAFSLKNTDENHMPLSTEEISSIKNVSETEETVAVNQNVDYKYIIVEEGDYLTVYHADGTTLYEYTDIQYSRLPETLRRKIRKGYCIKTEAELFGFLENYSS